MFGCDGLKWAFGCKIILFHVKQSTDWFSYNNSYYLQTEVKRELTQLNNDFRSIEKKRLKHKNKNELYPNFERWIFRVWSLAWAGTRISFSGWYPLWRYLNLAKPQSAADGAAGHSFGIECRKIPPKSQSTDYAHIFRERDDRSRTRNSPDAEQQIDLVRGLFSDLVTDSGLRPLVQFNSFF